MSDSNSNGGDSTTTATDSVQAEQATRRETESTVDEVISEAREDAAPIIAEASEEVAEAAAEVEEVLDEAVEEIVSETPLTEAQARAIVREEMTAAISSLHIQHEGDNPGPVLTAAATGAASGAAAEAASSAAETALNTEDAAESEVPEDRPEETPQDQPPEPSHWSRRKVSFFKRGN